jgi:predicted HTH domain antitoxin
MLDPINKIPQERVLSTAEQTSQNEYGVATQAFINNSETIPSNCIPLDHRGVTKTTDNPLVSHKITEEHFINHFRNGRSLKTLSFDELVKLYEISIFSKNDMAEITDTKFIVYLYDKNHISFDSISEELKKDVAILKYNSGDYSFIKYIPYEDQTQDMFNAFLNKIYNSNKDYAFYGYGPLFKYFSKDFQTKEVWNKILQSKLNIHDIKFMESCQKVNHRIKEYPKQHQQVIFIDTDFAFLNTNKELVLSLFAKDGIYLNNDGYAI